MREKIGKLLLKEKLNFFYDLKFYKKKKKGLLVLLLMGSIEK